jgi:hypothetical protein
MKISSNKGLINYQNSIVTGSGQNPGFQMNLSLKMQKSDSVYITEEARNMFMKRNLSPLIKAVAGMLNDTGELMRVLEKSSDTIRNKEISKLGDRIKTGMYNFDNNKILNTTGEIIIELLLD